MRNREDEGVPAQAGLPRSRLAPLLWAAGKLVAEVDVRAVAPLMKVLDWLDRRKRVAGAVPADGDGLRERPPVKVNARSAGPEPDKAAAEARRLGAPQTAARRKERGNRPKADATP